MKHSLPVAQLITVYDKFTHIIGQVIVEKQFHDKRRKKEVNHTAQHPGKHKCHNSGQEVDNVSPA